MKEYLFSKVFQTSEKGKMYMENLLSILTQQIETTRNILGSIQVLAINSIEVTKEEISESDKKAQIKSIMASASIQMTSLNSQDVLIQQTIDKILELVNE